MIQTRTTSGEHLAKKTSMPFKTLDKWAGASSPLTIKEYTKNLKKRCIVSGIFLDYRMLGCVVFWYYRGSITTVGANTQNPYPEP